MFRFLRCLLSFLLLPAALCGQVSAPSDTTDQRKSDSETIAVRIAPRSTSIAGALQAENLLETARPNATAADWFALTGAGYAKQYGPGNIATLSLRGTGAAQTAVTWHGVPLNSPMLGLADLSLVPLSLFRGAQLLRGGGQVRLGNAAVAGVLQLDEPVAETPVPVRRAHLRLGAGSFGQWSGDLGAAWSGARFGASLRAHGSLADNDFPFANAALPGAPRQRQRHASFRNGGILADAFWSHRRFRFDAAFWRQSAWRQVPPNMAQDTATAEQSDDASRLVLGARLEDPRLPVQPALKVAYFRERLRYRDPSIGLNTDDLAQTVFGELRCAGEKGRHSFSAQAQIWQEAVRTESYADLAQRQRYALSASHRVRLGKKFFLETGIRAEKSNFGWAPPIPSLRVEWQLPVAGLCFEAQAAGHYRIPTFNDLFWREAGARGNSALSPEQGWNAQFGTAFSPAIMPKNAAFRTQVRLFAQQTRGLIVWIPDGQGIWTPENIGSVRNAGVEFDLKTGFSRGDFRVEQTASVNLVRSVQLDGRNPQANGKQLPYVPVCQATASFRLGWRNLSLAYRHQFVSARFLTATNTESLPAHQLGFVDARADFRLKKTVFSLYFLLNNCWDVPYQLVQWRAMPGRNWEAGVRCSF